MCRRAECRTSILSVKEETQRVKASRKAGQRGVCTISADAVSPYGAQEGLSGVRVKKMPRLNRVLVTNARSLAAHIGKKGQRVQKTELFAAGARARRKAKRRISTRSYGYIRVLNRRISERDIDHYRTCNYFRFEIVAKKLLKISCAFSGAGVGSRAVSGELAGAKQREVGAKLEASP